MRTLLILATLCILRSTSFAQPVGYLGKQCILSGGLGIGSNVLANFAPDYYIDDLVAEGDEPSFAIKPFFHVQAEVVVLDHFSLFARWQPVHFRVNAGIYEDIYTPYGLSLVTAKGGMTGVGWRWYFTETPAPLTNYFTFSLLYLNYDITVEEHSENFGVVPEDLLTREHPGGPNYGISAGFGFQNIYYDKLCLDFCMELNYIFQNAAQGFSFPTDDSDYSFNELSEPSELVRRNMNVFIVAQPALHVGYLLF